MTEVKRGRPLKELTAEQVKLAGQLAGVGCNYNQIADVLGVSPATFDRLIARDESLFEAVNRGRSKAEARVLQTAFQMATSGKHPWMTGFWLRCKLGWKEERPVREDEDATFNLNYKKDQAS